MSDASTIRMIQAYMDEASAPSFLTSFSRTPPENFHNSEFVEIDIQRNDPDVAVVVHDVTSDGRVNKRTLYTNKRFKPPVFKEQAPLSVYESDSREMGTTPFDDVNYMAKLTRESFSVFRLLEDKIRRAVELMWSQVFQTGVVTLTDTNGAAVYTLDYQQKDNHRRNAAVTWAADGSAGDPASDLAALSTEIRQHGKRRPNTLIFGRTAFPRFLQNAQIRELLDNRRMNRGEVVRPSREREDAKFHGVIAIDNEEFEIWLYDGFYRDPVSGELTDYVGANNVIMLASDARFDTSYGGIPLIRPEGRALQFLPTVMNSPERGLSITPNSWIAQDNSGIVVQAGSRPLAIPTAIDCFGVLNIEAAA